MRTIISLALVGLTALIASAQIPKNVTPYSYVDYETMHDQAINSNAPYAAKILTTMSKLACDANSKGVYQSYISFFSEPSTTDPLFGSATKLLDIAYAGTDLDIAIIDIYTSANLCSYKAGFAKTPHQLSQIDSIRINAKYLGFNNPITDSAAKQITLAALNAQKETDYNQKKAERIAAAQKAEEGKLELAKEF